MKNNGIPTQEARSILEKYASKRPQIEALYAKYYQVQADEAKKAQVRRKMTEFAYLSIFPMTIPSQESIYVPRKNLKETLTFEKVH